MNNMEVITTRDKEARDRMFQDLRRNGNELERQVVKFSGVELDVDAPAPIFRQTWSIAYPRS